MVGALASALVIGLALGVAVADRRTTAPPLVYAGTVLDGDAPVADGDHDIGIALFADVSGGTALCTIAPAAIATTLGHFSLPVSAAECGAAVQAEEELYVELSVDGTTLPRARIGAVPYAVRAERTVLHSGDRPITDGLYCGATAPVNGRIRSDATTLGYPAAANLCATACGSPSAHVCSRDEIVRDWQAGTTGIPVGWVVLADVSSGSDCVGWTENATGTGWIAMSADASGSEFSIFNSSPCNGTRPLLCCD